jgi:anti-sigma factor RsiW
MTSDHVSEVLSPYIDGRVSVEERERIGRHLETCAACRGSLASLQEVVELLRSVPPVTAPEQLRAAIRSRVEHAGVPPAHGGLWHLPKLRWPRLAATWRPMAAAVAAVVIGVFAVNLLGPQLPASASDGKTGNRRPPSRYSRRQRTPQEGQTPQTGRRCPSRPAPPRPRLRMPPSGA